MLKSSSSPRRRAAITVQLLRGLELPTQFGLTIVAANTMGPTSFGRFGVLLAIQAVISVTVSFGYDELLQRAVSRKQSLVSGDLSLALGARITLVVLLIFLGFGASIAVGAVAGDADLAYAVGLLSLASAANLLSSIFMSVAVSLNRVTVPFAASLLSWLAPLTIALTGFIYTLTNFALALMIGAFIRLFLTVMWAIRRMFLGDAIRRASRLLFRPRLLDGTKSHFSLVVYALNNQVLARHGDILIGGALGLSLSLLGSYSLAFQVTAMANSFLMIGLGSIALSYLSERSKDDALLGAAWRRISGLAALIAVGPISVLALTSPELVVLVFGENYPMLTELVLGLCVAQWGNRLGGGGTNTGTLIAAGLSSAVAKSSVGGGALNVALNLLLVPWLGVFGLVVGTGVSLLTIGVLNSIALSRRLNTRPPVRALLGLTCVVLGAVAMTASEVAIEVRWVSALVVLIVWAMVVLRSVRGVRS